MAGSAWGQVVVLAANSAAKTSGDTFTPAELGGFAPPAATDKLVVVISDEGSSPSSVTYAGTTLSQALLHGSGRYVAVYYHDYTTVPTSGDLVINESSGSGVSVLALQGTVNGFGASATANSTTSIGLDALFDGSLVVAGLVDNQNSGTYTGTADPPLTTLLEDANVGSSLGVSGYAVVNAGLATYSFSSLSAGNADFVLAVAFPAAGADDIPPAIASVTAVDEVGNPTTSLLTDAVLTLNFDEGIFAGSGFILLKESGGDTAQSYDVTSAPQLSFGVDSVTIAPDVLDPETSYYVQVPTGALEDSSGNTTNYPDNTLEFTTGPWKTLSRYGDDDYSITELRGFDPTGYDKLVVITMDEGGGFPSAVTWGGSSALTLVVNNANGNERSSMWYLDGPFTGPANLAVTGLGTSFGVSLLALPGTDPGVAAFDNVSSDSISFTTTSDDSYVVAGYTCNGGGNSHSGAAPLATYLDRDVGSADGACGVAANSVAGAQTFSFTGTINAPSLVIAEFTITPPPDGSMILIR